MKEDKTIKNAHSLINEGGPKTIGVIMDGNRRFARERGLSPHVGHQAGFDKLKEFLGWAKEAKIHNIIIYAFSTENWKRAKEEVGYLMKLLEQVVLDRADELKREKIRIRFIGQLERFSEKIKNGMSKLEKDTMHNKESLTVALSYGGRAEIVEGIKKLVSEKGRAGALVLKEEDFGKFLWTAGLPDPDLIIRTSGEIRTSNFLPWQSAYSEWFFSNTLWPAFTKREFFRILEDYSARERRNGK